MIFAAVHSALDDYAINMALAHGSSRLCALTRLRAVVREDRERTRGRWALAGVHPGTGKLHFYWNAAIDEYAKRIGQPVGVVR